MAFLTIEQHILKQQRYFPQATGVFSGILYDIALSAKIIAHEIAQGALVGILGATQQSNVHGEVQKKLDLFADSTIFRTCSATGRLCIMASEEHEEALEIPAENGYGKYVLVYDPLDGSSNVDANVNMGTIFALYRKITPGDEGILDDLLQPGNQLAAAGYVIYGPSTMLVYSTGQGVHGFTLDPLVGEFLLTHESITIPGQPSYYSVNQGNEKQWSAGVQKFVGMLQGKLPGTLPNLAARYTGSLVADFHRNLLHGGIYLYPADVTDNTASGKLRLVYEGIPLAFIAQQAGGYASDGIRNVLDITPHTLHQRIPLFVGNRTLVEAVEQLILQDDSG